MKHSFFPQVLTSKGIIFVSPVVQLGLHLLQKYLGEPLDVTGDINAILAMVKVSKFSINHPLSKDNVAKFMTIMTV